MTLSRSEFRFKHRGFKETIILIPGWASDYRIFDKLELKFNYLIPVRLSATDFNERLIESMQENALGKISVFAWSMGVFLAADFIRAYPERAGEYIFFVSAKKSYDAKTISAIKTYLTKNRKGYLYRFYQDCFSGQEEECFFEFKRGLLKSYLNSITTEALLEGLEYLSGICFKLGCRLKSNIIFIHGGCDRIAPISEALELKSEFSGAEFMMMQDSGHVPFLNPRFNSMLNEYVDR